MENINGGNYYYILNEGRVVKMLQGVRVRVKGPVLKTLDDYVLIAVKDRRYANEGKYALFQKTEEGWLKKLNLTRKDAREIKQKMLSSP